MDTIYPLVNTPETLVYMLSLVIILSCNFMKIFLIFATFLKGFLGGGGVFICIQLGILSLCTEP